MTFMSKIKNQKSKIQNQKSYNYKSTATKH